MNHPTVNSELERRIRENFVSSRPVVVDLDKSGVWWYSGGGGVWWWWWYSGMVVCGGGGAAGRITPCNPPHP